MTQKLLILLTGISLSLTAFGAGKDFCEDARKKPARCNYKDLSEAQDTNSAILTDEVGAKLLELEKSEKAAGRELKVVIVARQGTNLDKLAVIKDKDAQGRYRSIDQLIEMVKPSPFDGNDSGKKTPGEQIMAERDKTKSMKYSHIGIAVKNHPDSDPSSGFWTVYQLLWACESNFANIHEDGMYTFFRDHMANYGAQIMIPSVNLQENLEKLLLDKVNRSEIVRKWHQKNYNAAARWDDLSEQNSNQWVLEVLGAAMYPVGKIQGREQAQQALRATNYHPTIVLPTGLYSFVNFPGVSKFLPSTICFANQKYASNYGVGEIVTALSAEEYLKTNNALLGMYEVQVGANDLVKDTDFAPAPASPDKAGK